MMQTLTSTYCTYCETFHSVPEGRADVCPGCGQHATIEALSSITPDAIAAYDDERVCVFGCARCPDPCGLWLHYLDEGVVCP